jgi:heme-degrading monooxygenase HmoA
MAGPRSPGPAGLFQKKPSEGKIMYVNLRRYPKVGASREAIERSVADELLPELRKQRGFKGYCAFWDEDGAGVSVSVFEDREAAQKSTAAARQWVMRHQDFFPERGEEFSGECVTHEGSHGREQGAGEGQGALFVLVRELDNVPGTQDTRAFVQQRTLPMITRSPGFKGVYMVRSDRDEGRAAVVTLFDGKQQAVASHGRAVELLKEGLPGVTVTRVVQGQSVILAVGD